MNVVAGAAGQIVDVVGDILGPIGLGELNFVQKKICKNWYKNQNLCKIKISTKNKNKIIY